MRSFILFALLQAVSTSGYSAQKTFTEKIDDLWPLIEVVMSNYQVKLNDIDKRVFETAFASGKAMWKEPQSEKSYVRYSTKIIVRLLKSKKREAYKMIVKKITRHKPNFFDSYKYFESNGVEEKVILYRINRELKIKKKRDKANEEQNKASNDDTLEDSGFGSDI